MKYVIDESKCSGCSACKNVCPKNAITMKENEEGFLYPVIDELKCINCNLCTKTCPVLNKKKCNDIPETIIAKNTNNLDRKTSSSGGIFQLIASYILDNKGIVYGATYKDKKVYHIGIEKENELDKIKGSKYVQSNVSNIFTDIKDNLDKKRLVFFCGTACQVAGLKAFLRKEYDNLYTADVICHGTPSPKVFEEYCKYLEKEYNSKIKDYYFRNKDISWRFYQTKVIFNNNKIYKNYYVNDMYIKAFLQNISLRKSCYECRFKENKHVSDITLGDYWGIKKYHKSFNDKKGISVIFLNTLKGKEIITKLNNIEYKDIPFNEAIYLNEAYYKSSKYNNRRESFFKDFNNKGIIKSLNDNVIKTPKYKEILRNIAIKILK